MGRMERGGKRREKRSREVGGRKEERGAGVDRLSAKFALPLDTIGPSNIVHFVLIQKTCTDTGLV